MQGKEFFRCGGNNANRCGIIQAHKGEQAFGIGLVAVAVDDNDLAAFFGDLVKTLALGKAADAGGKFVCCAHHAASSLVFLWAMKPGMDSPIALQAATHLPIHSLKGS